MKNNPGNWKIKLVCVLLAVVTFFVVSQANQAERIVSLPVTITLPEDLLVASNITNSVDLIITGNEEKIYMVDVNKISLSADFSGAKGEGIFSAPVLVDMGDSGTILDFNSVSIKTNPSYLKIYFAGK